jgi:hypothetical protein
VSSLFSGFDWQLDRNKITASAMTPGTIRPFLLIVPPSEQACFNPAQILLFLPGKKQAPILGRFFPVFYGIFYQFFKDEKS